MTPPRFVPFEAMTDWDRGQHLRRVHGCDSAHMSMDEVRFCHDSRAFSGTPHTHDKPARTRTEENT